MAAVYLARTDGFADFYLDFVKNRKIYSRSTIPNVAVIFNEGTNNGFLYIHDRFWREKRSRTTLGFKRLSSRILH